MTVSRYLPTPERVSSDTGEKIAKIIEDINYIPNRAPEMLLNAKSYTPGVLIPSFKNQIVADLLSGIEAAELLLKKIGDQHFTADSIELSYQIVMGETIGSLNRQ